MTVAFSQGSVGYSGGGSFGGSFGGSGRSYVVPPVPDPVILNVGELIGELLRH